MWKKGKKERVTKFVPSTLADRNVEGEKIGDAMSSAAPRAVTINNLPTLPGMGLTLVSTRPEVQSLQERLSLRCRFGKESSEEIE